MRRVVQGFFLSRFTKVVFKLVVIVIVGLTWRVSSSGQTLPIPISFQDAEMVMKTDPPPPLRLTRSEEERGTEEKPTSVSSPAIDFKKKKFVVPPSGGRFGQRNIPAEAGTTNKHFLESYREISTRRAIDRAACPAPPVSAGSQDGGLNDHKTSPGSSPPHSRPPSGTGSNQRGDMVGKGFRWDSAFKQSFFFIAIMNGFRIATEPGTRAELRGPFFKDYFASIRSLRGWRDGDEFYVNYVGHPMQGAVSGFIQIHNDPKAVKELENTPEYWKSRLKAMGWATIVSTQFELGPLSEASLGNVGLKPTEKSRHPMGYVDLVVTPTLGTAWLVGEDAVDRYLIRKIEARTRNQVVRAIVRTFLNPSRSFANLLRFKPTWYRDRRSL